MESRNGETISLCVFARRVNSQDAGATSNLLGFRGEKWLPEHEISGSCAQLQEALTMYERAHTRKICFIIQRNGASLDLALVYIKTPQRVTNAEKAIAAIVLPILFHDCNVDFNDDTGVECYLKRSDTKKLYEQLHLSHKQVWSQQSIALSLPAEFAPTLRPYQQRSVAWMLKRETQPDELGSELYTPLHARCGATDAVVYKRKHLLDFEKTAQLPMPPGGILADEMGLGKTVELLALVTLHAREQTKKSLWHAALETFLSIPIELDGSDRYTKEIVNELFCFCMDRQDVNTVTCSVCKSRQHRKCVMRFEFSDTSSYLCPLCVHEFSKHHLLDIKATIVVTPSVIKSQWETEIERHITSDLKVLVYRGIKQGHWLTPTQLAMYDIIITDYNVLRGEFHFSEDKTTSRAMRKKPIFMNIISPLVMVNWWRVCLDESQMVDSDNSNITELLRKLPAHNRWAVTGTPITRSMNDLCPLINFIGLPAVCRPAEGWLKLVKGFTTGDDCEALLHLLQKFMWRTCKSMVQHELTVPAPAEIVHRIDLSSIEALHYQDLHADCAEEFRNSLPKNCENSKHETLAKLSVKSLKSIMQPFLIIRQSCSMAVMRSGVAKRWQGACEGPRQYMEPAELHGRLENATLVACKTILRNTIVYSHGMASVKMATCEPDAAIELYKRTLKTAQEYSEIGVDSLLQIHAIHNIVKNNVNATVITAEEVNDYRRQLHELENKFLATPKNYLQRSSVTYEAILARKETQEKPKSLMQQLRAVINDNDDMHPILMHKIEREYVQKERLELYGFLKLFADWHNEIRSYLKTFAKMYRSFEAVRQAVCETSDAQLSQKPEVLQLMQKTYNCHLDANYEDIIDKQPAKRFRKDKCQLCELSDLINKFRCLIFAKKAITKRDKKESADGTKNPSTIVRAIKVALHVFQGRSRFQDYAASIEKHFKWIIYLGNHLDAIHDFWTQMDYLTKSLDELNMCKTTFSSPSEALMSSYQYYERCYAGSSAEFRQKLNKLRYIRHLLQEPYGECKICLESSQIVKYTVLECGHYMCYVCWRKLMEQSVGGLPHCPFCRNRTSLSFHTQRVQSQRQKSKAVVLGNHSSKIDYIVRLVLKMKSEDNDPQNPIKIIIFSLWEPILKGIAKALKDNMIEVRARCIPKDIQDFKNPEEDVTCLLLPYSGGSKGINLIEATHVFLVEPTIDHSEEFQAIGRVYRFGQTKKTTVHRFIVNNTIEEKIYNFINSADNKGCCEEMNLSNLMSLFECEPSENTSLIES